MKQAIILLLSNSYGVIPMTNVKHAAEYAYFEELRSGLLQVITDVKGKEWKEMADKLLNR